MKFDELDQKMRVFETAHDHRVLPEMYMVVRLDGRNFTKLTKERHKFKAPFDERFRDLMLQTTEHLMNVGFNVVYGYTESDEISLLLAENETTFGRKLRKINSVLAGEASAKLSLLLCDTACFDSRVSQLPNATLVCDYFRWRQEDAHRNSLNSHCYWALRKHGLNARAATSRLAGLSVANKNELLFQNGVNFNDLPLWQKRGCGLVWENYEKEALNPTTGESVTAIRRRVRKELELPCWGEYDSFVALLLNGVVLPK